MLEISPVYIALREMTRRNSPNDFANGRAHSKGRPEKSRCGKGGKREERREATRRIRTISYNHPCLLFFFILSLSPRQSGSRYSPPETSRISLFNDCGTTIDITCREWTSNEPVTPSVCVDEGRPLIFKDIAG